MIYHLVIMPEKMKSQPGKSATTDDTQTTSFGYREVATDERQDLVNDVFSTVAGRYDLMNDLMSGGVHRLWKRELISMLNPPRSGQPFQLLDMAGGTGDIALRAIERGGSGCHVTLSDINAEMLEVGRQRVKNAGREAQVECVQANAEMLPFASQSFDAYTIAFGMRNVTRIDKALREALRVLKPGGRFLCLEFSQCQVPVLDELYEFHSFRIIPYLGKVAAGAAEPYQYLVESIRKFPNQDRFARMIREAGFERVSYKNLTGGVASIHSGWRI